jgi:hypothetical protein
MTAKSKILKGNQNQTIQVKRENNKEEEERIKRRDQQKLSRDRKKEQIRQNAIDNLLADKIVKENKTKETALAEFIAMNAAAQKAVLTPFITVIPSKSRKNSGADMSSSSKMAAMDDDTDKSNAETEYSTHESEAEGPIHLD